MSNTTTDTVWMTAAALAALEAELAELVGREASAETDAARIAQLRDLIRRADTSDKPDDGLVEPGMTVTARFADGDEETFLLGSRAAVAGDVELDVYSADSPLGQAIIGRTVGDRVRYTAPNGRELEVEIISAVPFA